jgi:Zn-dependent M28 family amino/carboxypeptidase
LEVAYFISIVLINVLGIQRLWLAKLVFALAFRIVFPFWHFMSPDKGTPGAGDNLISSVMGCVLAKYYSGRPRLKHTQLYFVSHDAEELMLKGSRTFFRRHKFREAKTWNFNVDCPYCPDDLKFLTRDVNGFVALSKRLALKLRQIAHELGYKSATAVAIPFNNGGTDAGEAARIGIEATTLIGMSFTPYNSRGRLQVYHTPDDTVANIFSDCTVATMSIFAKFVEEIDAGVWPEK